MDDSLPVIYLGTVGALANDCRLDPFVIPDSLDSFYNIEIRADVSGSLNFWEDNAAPAGETFTEGILDLGPDKDMVKYGDQGLHPFSPKFAITVTSGDTDAVAMAVQAYQVPQACADSLWTDPQDCFCKFCENNPEDEFCVKFAAEKE
jgi:hypothetical protein